LGVRAHPPKIRPRSQRRSDTRRKVTRPTVLDLFSGCGGLTWGFVDAGFKAIGGIETDADAIQSYAENFHRGKPDFARPCNITESSPEEALKMFGVTPDEIHAIVGGPPCPAFAHIGRAKLAQVNDNDPDAYLKDPRAQLWHQYLKWVDYIRPPVLLMENVPGILNWGGTNVGDQICEHLQGHDYVPVYALLNSANYGVPQSRLRFFLVATRKDLIPDGFVFPEETHAYTTPSANQQAMLRGDDYRRVARRSLRPKQPVSVENALDDLPEIDASFDVYKRDSTPPAPYQNAGLHPYAKSMRTSTPGNPQLHTTHTRLVTKRDLRIFKRMQEGDIYPDALAIATDIYVKECEQNPGAVIDKRDFVPPYDANKYKDKWWKLNSKEPSKTIMAHLAKDGYSHIHYRQPRMLSVREAARLQSFPDDFIFRGSMTSAFRQIGNAVPPRMAQALAAQILKLLKSSL
jgi:DNA (cytosine-5)-methyltransferase 1